MSSGPGLRSESRFGLTRSVRFPPPVNAIGPSARGQICVPKPLVVEDTALKEVGSGCGQPPPCPDALEPFSSFVTANKRGGQVFSAVVKALRGQDGVTMFEPKGFSVRGRALAGGQRSAEFKVNVFSPKAGRGGGCVVEFQRRSGTGFLFGGLCQRVVSALGASYVEPFFPRSPALGEDTGGRDVLSPNNDPSFSELAQTATQTLKDLIGLASSFCLENKRQALSALAALCESVQGEDLEDLMHRLAKLGITTQLKMGLHSTDCTVLRCAATVAARCAAVPELEREVLRLSGRLVTVFKGSRCRETVRQLAKLLQILSAKHPHVLRRDCKGLEGVLRAYSEAKDDPSLARACQKTLNNLCSTKMTSGREAIRGEKASTSVTTT